MSYTKKQLINHALAELGLADYVFDMQAEDYQTALDRLDAMIAQWRGSGVVLPYPIASDNESSDLDSDSNLPAYANNAVILNLAMQLAPSYGKSLQQLTMINARKAYDNMLKMMTSVPTKQYPAFMPAGAGNKPARWGRRFLPFPTDHVDSGPEGALS